MYLVDDIVKFRDKHDLFKVVDVNDSAMESMDTLRYSIKNTRTNSLYKFWVYEEDLQFHSAD